MDIQGLSKLLQTSLSSSLSELKASESQLNQLESQAAGQLLMLLLQIGFDGSQTLAVRQASAIYCKNLLKRRWSPKVDEPGAVAGLSEGEKESVRLLLVEATCGSNAVALERQIQVQVNAIIGFIAELDFPKRWPALLPSLVQTLNSSPSNELRLNALNVLCSVFKKYKTVSRSTEVLQELQYVLPIFQATHLTLFTNIVPALIAGGGKEVYGAAENVLDIFYSMNVVDIPEFYQDHVGAWMEGFLKILHYAGGNEFEPLKAQVCANLGLYADKYQEVFEPFVPETVKAVWGLLTTSNSDGLVAAGIKFLSSTASTRWSPQNSPFEEDAALVQICEKLVIPNVQLRDSDIELFVENPEDYLRRDLLNADSDTRRRSAIDLVRALSKFYEARTTEILLHYVSVLLGTNETRVRAKDACIQLVTAIAIKGETRALGVSQVNAAVDLGQFFKQHLLPELVGAKFSNSSNCSDEQAVLVASCLKFVILFRSQLGLPTLNETLPIILKELIKPESPQVLASYASHCACLLLQAGASAGGLADAAMEDCLRTIMSTGDQNEYHMKLVLKLLSIHKNASVLPKLLALMTTVSANPMNAAFTHYLFESIGLLCNSSIVPPLCQLLEKNVSEYIPYAFQLLGLVLEESTTRMDVFAHLYPILLNEELWKNPSLGAALVRIMSAYLTKSGLYMDLIGPNVPALLARFTILFNSTKFETDAFELLCNISASEIPAQTLTENLPSVFMTLLTKIHTKRSDKLVKSLGVFLSVLVAGQLDIGTIAAILDKVQAGLSVQVIKDLWMTNFQHLNFAVQTNKHKKVIAIAFAKLLSADLVKGNEMLLNSIVQTTTNMLCVPKEVDKSLSVIVHADEAHDFEVGYAKLSATSSAIRNKDYFPQIPGDGIPQLKQAVQQLSAHIQHVAPLLVSWAAQ